MTSETKRAIFRLACRVAPRLLTACLPVEAARLGTARIPRLTSDKIEPLDPSLNDDLLALYGRSEQVLANRFAFLNRLRCFDRGIDWAPPESPAWQAELHAFDYAVDLALTHRISAEEKYARHLRYLIAHWVAENPPFQLPGWSLGPLARRVRNWVLAADLSRTAWDADSEFSRVAGEGLALQTLYLQSFLPEHVDDLSAFDSVRALLYASQVFRGSRSSALRETAFDLLAKALTARARQEGAWSGSGPALRLGLAATLLDWLIARWNLGVGFHSGQPAPSPGRRGSLHFARWQPVSSWATRPRGPRQCRGTRRGGLDGAQVEERGGTLRHPPNFLLGEEGRRRFQSLADNAPWSDRRASAQAGCYRHSAANGCALIISAGPSGSGLGHANHPGFELVIRGWRTVVEATSDAPEGEPEGEPVASAAKHNVLLINGRPPNYPARERGDGPQRWQEMPEHAGVRIEDEGYAFLGIRHSRAWVQLPSFKWLIVDRLEGKFPREVSCLLHFYPTFQVQIGPDRALVRSLAEAVTAISIATSPTTIETSRGDQGEFPGWYAPRPGLKYPSSVLTLKWSTPALPWIGVQVIAPGDQSILAARLIAVHAERIEMEIGGERLLLPA